MSLGLSAQFWQPVIAERLWHGSRFIRSGLCEHANQDFMSQAIGCGHGTVAEHGSCVDDLPVPAKERSCSACSQAGRQGQRSGRPPGVRLGLWRQAATRHLSQELAGAEPRMRTCCRRTHTASARAPCEPLATIHPQNQLCRYANALNVSGTALLLVLHCNADCIGKLLCEDIPARMMMRRIFQSHPV